MASLPTLASSSSASFLASPCSSSSSSSSFSSSSASRPVCLRALCFRHIREELRLLNQAGSDYGVPSRTFKRIFSVKAMDVSGPGSIESGLMGSMKEKLQEQLNTNEVVVKDAYGDGRHVSIEVVSSEFEGKSSVNRQRMVYKAIWEELQTTVHAVDNMRTLTPEESVREKSQEPT